MRNWQPASEVSYPGTDARSACSASGMGEPEAGAGVPADKPRAARKRARAAAPHADQRHQHTAAAPTGLGAKAAAAPGRTAKGWAHAAGTALRHHSACGVECEKLCTHWLYGETTASACSERSKSPHVQRFVTRKPAHEHMLGASAGDAALCVPACHMRESHCE